MSKKRFPARVPRYVAGIRAQETRTGARRSWWAVKWLSDILACAAISETVKRCSGRPEIVVAMSDIFASVFSEGRFPDDCIVRMSIRRINVRRTSVR